MRVTNVMCLSPHLPNESTMLSSLLTRRNCMEFSKACQVVHPKRGPAVLLRSSDRTAPPIVVTGLAPYLAVRVSPTAPRAAIEALPQALNSVLAGRFHFASSEDPESSAIEWCFMEKSEDGKYPKLIRDWTIIGWGLKALALAARPQG